MKAMANQEKKQPTAKRKRTKEQARLLSVLKAVCVIVVLLALIVVAAQRFGNVTFSSVSDYFGTLISGTRSGDGYPYYFENTSVETVEPIGSDLFVLGEDSTFVLDSTARKLGFSQHSFSSPAAYGSNGRVLMLDVGENSYQILSKTKVLYEDSFPQRLLTGAIGKDGTVALASRGAQSQSALTVYNKNHKEIFAWNCASENIISVAVSDNGSRAAVSVIGAENGELYSKVHIFDFDCAEPIATFEYDTAVSGVQFLSGKRLLMTGKNIFTIIDDTTVVLEEDLSLNTLSHVYTDDSRFTVVALSKYGSTASQIIRAYNRKGELLFETELAESVKGLSCDSGYVSVLTDTFLYNYRHSGELVGKAPVDSDCIKPFTDGRNTYVYALSGIKCFKTTEVAEEPAASEAETVAAAE